MMTEKEKQIVRHLMDYLKEKWNKLQQAENLRIDLFNFLDSQNIGYALKLLLPNTFSLVEELIFTGDIDFELVIKLETELYKEVEMLTSSGGTTSIILKSGEIINI